MNANSQTLLPSGSKIHKSFYKILLLTLNLCLSAFYIGYCISYLGIENFNKQKGKGLVIKGSLPIGAAFGALFSILLLKKFSRRKSLLVVNCLTIIVRIICLIEFKHLENYSESNWYLIMISRLAQGFCVGIYSVLVPIIIREFAPIEIYAVLGSIFQCFIALGIFMPFFLKWILKLQNENQLIFGFTIFPVSLQTFFLIFIHKFQTPKFLLSNKFFDECKRVIKYLYKQETAKIIYDQKYKQVYPFKEPLLKETQLNNIKNKIKFRKIRILVTFLLAIQQQFCGINIFIIFPSSLLEQLKFIVIGTGLQFIGTVFAIYLFSKIGRKKILLFGNISLLLTFSMILFVFLFEAAPEQQNTVAIELLFVLLIGSFGLTLGPFFWIYVPEIVPPEVIPFSTFAYWIAGAIVIFMFPFDEFENFYYMLLFFLGWSLLSLITNKVLVVETKGKTEDQIYFEYDNII